MLILKNLLIGAATLTLLGIVAITPTQAFTLKFESTDGKMTGNIVSQNNWQPNLYDTGPSSLSITGQGWGLSGSLIWFPGSGMQVGNQWSFKSIAGIGHVQLAMLDYAPPILINYLPPHIPLYWSMLFLATSTKYPSISLLCHSAYDCLGDYGTITLRMSIFDYYTDRVYSWDGYSGEIKVTEWNPTLTSISTISTIPPTASSTSIPTVTEPSHSVLEPSPVNALLLLGSGWFLWRKLGFLRSGRR